MDVFRGLFYGVRILEKKGYFCQVLARFIINCRVDCVSYRIAYTGGKYCLYYLIYDNSFQMLSFLPIKLSNLPGGRNFPSVGNPCTKGSEHHVLVGPTLLIHQGAGHADGV